MTMVIWKTTLKAVGSQEIELPLGAEILCAREQHEAINLWYRCNPSAPKEIRKIVLRGTGHPAPAREQAHYLGTAMLHSGALVMHVFEELGAPSD